MGCVATALRASTRYAPSWAPPVLLWGGHRPLGRGLRLPPRADVSKGTARRTASVAESASALPSLEDAMEPPGGPQTTGEEMRRLDIRTVVGWAASGQRPQPGHRVMRRMVQPQSMPDPCGCQGDGRFVWDGRFAYPVRGSALRCPPAAAGRSCGTRRAGRPARHTCWKHSQQRISTYFTASHPARTRRLLWWASQAPLWAAHPRCSQTRSWAQRSPCSWDPR